jgi:hypothetical protein
VIFTAILIVAGTSHLMALNSDLAKAKENEILSREIMRKQEAEEEIAKKKASKARAEAAYDAELEMLIRKKRHADALEYIDERLRLAFEQGNQAREDMYKRYRTSIEFEMRDRSQDGF